jgi:hypothetical protein
MTQNFDVTLNKLQRCLETIKSSLTTEQLYNIFEFQYNGIELVNSDNVVVTDSLVAKGMEQLATAKLKTDDYFKLYDDLYRLESSLFNGNANSGMSLILSQIKYLKEMKTKVASLNGQLKNYASYTTCTKDTIAPKLNMLAQNTLVKKLAPQWNGTLDTTRIYMLTYDTNDYETKLTQLTKQISDLENKRDKLNATFTVTVELSTRAQQLLGL